MPEKSLSETGWANRQRRGGLLAIYVLACLAAGDYENAAAIQAELEASTELHSTELELQAARNLF